MVVGCLQRSLSLRDPVPPAAQCRHPGHGKTHALIAGLIAQAGLMVYISLSNEGDEATLAAVCQRRSHSH